MIKGKTKYYTDIQVLSGNTIRVCNGIKVLSCFLEIRKSTLLMRTVIACVLIYQMSTLMNLSKCCNLQRKWLKNNSNQNRYEDNSKTRLKA